LPAGEAEEEGARRESIFLDERATASYRREGRRRGEG
jgi:hypothetical protein